MKWVFLAFLALGLLVLAAIVLGLVSEFTGWRDCDVTIIGKTPVCESQPEVSRLEEMA